MNIKEKQKIINPSTGEVIAEVSFASNHDLDLAIESARSAFDNGQWGKVPLGERKDFLLKISQGILENASELAQLESLNTGKPIKESMFMDLPSSAKAFEYLANNLEKYLDSEVIDIEKEARCKLTREPMGVVALIVPWNYPLLIASWKLASALAAGNTVILKPSSLTPLTALKLAEIIKNAGLPDGVLNVVNGRGDILGKQICQDKRIDMISFTGSNAVGKKIIENSSENVKKLIMELGGKSAGIILKDVDIDIAVNSSLCSVFLNQGQMCAQMSRILVEDNIYDKFIDSFVEKTKRMKLGQGLDYETQIGPLISEQQRGKVIACVEKAKADGAKLVCGGKIPSEPKLKNGFFFEPAVFTDVLPDMSIFREEVFGPVVCISKFSTYDQAINLANDSDFGLAACVWSKDEKLAENIAGKINAGTIWINTYGMFYNQVPFGGFKQSGFGKELGREGFLEYTRLKNIILDKSHDAKPLVNYWYGL